MVEERLKDFKSNLEDGLGRQNLCSFKLWEMKFYQDIKVVFDDMDNVRQIVNIRKIIGTSTKSCYIPKRAAESIACKILSELALLKTRLEDSELVPRSHASHGGSSSVIDKSFSDLNELLRSSPLNTQISDENFKDVPGIALRYLQEAENAYKGSAYVACIVMLGAMLEALMMGTLIRDDLSVYVTSYVAAHPSFLPGGSVRTDLNQRIVERVNLDKYKQAIDEIIPASKSVINISLIQDFRNALHANKVLKEKMYIEPNEMWVDSHLHALVNLVMVLNQGNPA